MSDSLALYGWVVALGGIFTLITGLILCAVRFLDEDDRVPRGAALGTPALGVLLLVWVITAYAQADPEPYQIVSFPIAEVPEASGGAVHVYIDADGKAHNFNREFGRMPRAGESVRLSKRRGYALGLRFDLDDALEAGGQSPRREKR